jgi:hypothetical protein
MGNKRCHIFFFLVTCFAMAQNGDKTLNPNKDVLLIVTDSIRQLEDPNRPARSAFYSAVLPGLGQMHNKSYWKLPFVYGALGGGIFVYLQNDKEYDRLRNAFKIRLAGGTNDEFSRDDGTPIISTLALERAQQTSQRNKELSLLVTAAFYVLQIIEANVDGHLSNFNVDRNLSVNPYFDYRQSGDGFASGFAISYTF